MKIGIIFYSFSGNTRRACEFLKEAFAAKTHSVELFDLKPRQEVTSFLKQCLQAFLKKTPELEQTPQTDKYDLLVLASPVWAFCLAPALRTALNQIASLAGKQAACFMTYHSGAGKDKALKELEAVVKAKQGQIIFSQNLIGAKTSERSYLENEFKTLLETVV